MKLKTLITALSLFAFTACAQVGKPFPEQNVLAIKKGVTTKEEVRRLFGEPWRTGYEDGQQTWTYGNYRYTVLGQKDNSDLVIRFNEKDVVSSYSYSATKN
jgi:outer membrane protein assembly factor BamE (lipoprotein component of BamABCDE complex)